MHLMKLHRVLALMKKKMEIEVRERSNGVIVANGESLASLC